VRVSSLFITSVPYNFAPLKFEQVRVSYAQDARKDADRPTYIFVQCPLLMYKGNICAKS
jgi:hypothetical protein